MADTGKKNTSRFSSDSQDLWKGAMSEQHSAVVFPKEHFIWSYFAALFAALISLSEFPQKLG